jgi:hypothetical protein
VEEKARKELEWPVVLAHSIDIPSVEEGGGASYQRVEVGT